MAETGTLRVHEPPPPLTRRSRKTVLVSAGCVLGASLAVLAVLLTIAEISDGGTIVLIGAASSDDIRQFAVLCALAMVCVGVCLVPVSRRALIVLIPARAAAVLAVTAMAAALALSPTVTATPLLLGDCDTGYVVREKSFLLAGWGTVYRPSGILATAVTGVMGDDGYQPFADGAYAVSDDGQVLKVWYNVSYDRGGRPIDTAGDPALELPVLEGSGGSCG